ncbi:Endonuclease/exonuclease/phosphatase [Massariosphaeria phaeospora]|uniref:Endonuclease/exonuclease/phosphatase n=1 Tax=Massariosphaeria phaeospora TaxID=100035 RepID=A0A7C8ME36_9PLEO|nr:Endonuclease/exonuclease/phosphatase [Massariosphaeria phaeospora]
MAFKPMMVSKSMMPSLLKKQLAYTPSPQPFETFDGGSWRPSQPPASPGPRAPLTSIRVITWNITYCAMYPRARMAAALAYLRALVNSIPSYCAIIIHLQEMMEAHPDPEGDIDHCANDLSQFRNAAWVRRSFNLAGFDNSEWDSRYGVVSLVDRRLSIARVSRLRFVSEFERDALFVDVRLASSPGAILRLCNVHLDSSYGIVRPIQWAALAKHLQDTSAGIVASILAGDCNATKPRDVRAPQEHGFKDAYLEDGGKEGDEDGATWGFQSGVASKTRGPMRLDKVVSWGKVDGRGMEKVGVGIKIQDKKIAKEMEANGELTFVTDHYGVMAEFFVEQGLDTGAADAV